MSLLTEIASLVVAAGGGGAVVRIIGSYSDRRRAAADDRQQRREDAEAQRQADRDEAEQARANWQAVIDHLRVECADLRAECAELRRTQTEQARQQQEQAVALARNEERGRLLEERVQILTTQLEQAGRRHNDDVATIADLRAQLEVATDELEDARAEIISLRRRVDELERLLSDRNEPDYTGMGGVPKIPETITEKPRGDAT